MKILMRWPFLVGFLRKSVRLDQHTVGLHTIFIQIYMDAPLGVSKNQIFLQIKLLSFYANIAPKRRKLQKIVKIEKKSQSHLCWFQA